MRLANCERKRHEAKGSDQIEKFSFLSNQIFFFPEYRCELKLQPLRNRDLINNTGGEKPMTFIVRATKNDVSLADIRGSAFTALILAREYERNGYVVLIETPDQKRLDVLQFAKSLLKLDGISFCDHEPLHADCTKREG